ncbi:MAG: asnB 2 [Gammaproteobacteria bacterium]|nr:asnB 2 [Gammaproteobacteria bacterium]
MCGIAGVATRGSSPARETLLEMCNVMRHRGPDGDGFHVAPGVGLGMRRLAVIDLATGDQPVTNAAGTVHCVFNGEIYNYRELRRELIAKGHTFRGTGDSEIIPRLYDEHGLDFMSRLNGMFAIALWDSVRRRLVLTRDRLGIKPLFYSLRRGNLYFGSEVKCILAAAGSAGEIDPLGLDQLLTLEYTVTPTTLFNDVRKVQPGTWLTWTDGQLLEGSFWSLAAPTPLLDMPVPELAERLRSTVTEAVRRQLVSDVPLGAFLSGGIDSSILVAAMSEVSATAPLTFSVGFSDTSYSELRHARTVANHCGTLHHEEVLTPDYLAVLPDVLAQLDQPIADFSVFPTLLVARMARRHVTVALSGDGGDELFAGYDAYEADRHSARLLDWLPRPLRANIERLARLVPLGEGKRGFGNQLRRFLEGAALPAEWQHMRWMIFLQDDSRARLYRSEFRRSLADQTSELVSSGFDGVGSDRLAGQMRCDLRLYLAENILPKVDAMSMASSLEARVPYLDNEVIDLALAIASDLKLRGGTRKWILRKAFEGRLPREILQRGKEGFSMPMKNWLNHQWNSLMHELLNAENFARDGLFEARYVDTLMRQHEARTHNHSHLLWALMVFHLWRDRFGTHADRVGACVHAA